MTENGSCTLSLDVMKQLKMQYGTMGICVPKEGAAQGAACLEALAAAGFTSKMPESYMVGWPDDVAAASLSAVPAYERRARSLLYLGCWAMSGDLREGRFACAEAKADKVVKVTKTDDAHAEVKVARTLTFRPQLDAIEKACGAVFRPGVDETVTLTRTAAGWTAGSADVVAADAGPR